MIRKKAGALSYALIVMLLISVLLFSMLMLAMFQRDFANRIEDENDLIDDINSSISYGLVNYNELEKDYTSFRLSKNNFSVLLKKRKWGFLDLLQYKTVFKKDTLKKSLVLGNLSVNKLALYLSDYDKPLFLGGDCRIIGDMSLPNEGIKTFDFSGYNTYTHKGRIKKSLRHLPFVDSSEQELFVEFPITLTLDKLKTQNSNTFFEKAVLVELGRNTQLSGVNISGQYIIESKDSIVIEKTNIMEGVIIKSPKVRIKKGFKGAIQIFSSEKVILEENVELEYPSIIYVSNKSKNLDAKISISKDSRVIGAVIMNSKKENSSNSVFIEEKSKVIGDLYCKGKLQLKGSVYGTVYTDEFYLKTDAAEYGNTLLGVSITTTLPKNFYRINFLARENAKFGIIKRR